MEKELVLKQINTDLTELCINVGNRHVGSSGNLRATEYTACRMASAGFKVAEPEFQCIDWEYGEIILRAGNEKVEAFIGPYSPSCEMEGFFETAANVKELENKDFSGKIAVFHGELCREQIMPRNFIFYNPDEHKRIIRLLDQNFVTTEPWYQSDHSWFAMYGVPAVAVTSEKFMELTREITHTPKDNLERVDQNKIYDIACAMKELIILLNERI